ncbi:MAG: glycoside hydrolase family 2 TIM barrel-domain containing protein, partial [Clostridia bacterium]
AKPLQWSAEQPNLYALRLTLLDSSGVVREVAQTQIGFRRFELKDGVMQLNGKRILFHGVDRHEFCMSSGRALEEANMYADIRALKANNLNAVRTSHYPNNSFWYKLCDEYGIYLIDEANLETHGSWDQAKALGTEQWIVPNDNPQWLPAIIDRATSMQERDKNHPSVLIWSCGNESFGGRDIYEMSEHLRKRDPSRLVHYEGVCNDRRYNDTSDMESRMYPPAAAIAAYLEQHPEKPYILCEYTHAMGNSCGGMHKYVELEERFAQYQGGFIWDWIDQALLVTAPNGKPRLAYGGDFGDRPTDREFCGNGLLFADRTATPKMQEVKYLYQPIRLTPDESGVTIQNRHLFTNASAYLLHWSLLRNGTSIQKGTLNTLDVPAGEERRYALPVLAPCESGEYVLHCALSLRHTCDWAEADYELMHGDALIADLPAKPEASVEPYTITRGDHITGALGKRFEMLFSAAEGGLCSLRGIDNRELLSTAPSLSLFRAPTSNDRGNGDWQAEALWQASSVYAKGVLTDLCTDDGKLSLRFCYQLPLAGGVGIELRYTVLGDGKVRVDMDFPGKASLPDLPAFGLSLRLPRALRLVRYYGLGPQENYSDRKHGARLAAFSTTPAEGFTRNLRPQECGNHEGVRSLSVVDQNGYGLHVDQVDAPLSVSVLPYSASDIMNARHFDELAEPTYTYLDIAACRKGVGGDDSWGAPVHPEYHLPADRPYLLSFVLSVL